MSACFAQQNCFLAVRASIFSHNGTTTRRIGFQDLAIFVVRVVPLCETNCLSSGSLLQVAQYALG